MALSFSKERLLHSGPIPLPPRLHRRNHRRRGTGLCFVLSTLAS